MKPITTNRFIKRKSTRHYPYLIVAIIAFFGILFTELYEVIPLENIPSDEIVAYDNDGNNINSAQTIENGEIKVQYVDVGQGNCTLIYNNDEAVMIDTGMYTSYEKVKDALDSAEIKEIDCLVLTHPDADHISGAVELTEDRDYIVKSVMQVYGIKNDTDTYEMVQNNIDEFGISVINPKAGDVYEWCDAKFTVLGPVVTDQDVYDDTNSYSIVLRMDYGETSFLFTGDAPTTEINDIIAEGFNINVDVYQLSHHGSFNKCNDYLHLTAASPEACIVSCGLNNSYGFPHNEVVAYTEIGNIALYRTDTTGTITIITDGTEWRK